MKPTDTLESVWVFNGLGGTFPAAVFRTKEAGDVWIKANGVQGILTEYPLDMSAYDWCIAKGYFTPESEEQTLPKFKQQFSHAAQDHYHNENENEEQHDDNAFFSEDYEGWGTAVFDEESKKD